MEIAEQILLKAIDIDMPITIAGLGTAMYLAIKFDCIPEATLSRHFFLTAQNLKQGRWWTLLTCTFTYTDLGNLFKLYLKMAVLRRAFKVRSERNGLKNRYLWGTFWVGQYLSNLATYKIPINNAFPVVKGSSGGFYAVLAMLSTYGFALKDIKILEHLGPALLFFAFDLLMGDFGLAKQTFAISKNEKVLKQVISWKYGAVGLVSGVLCSLFISRKL